MEGLVADFPGDPKVLYGGGDDDDDSGSIQYLSIRYGGRVVGLNNELNGLSLGGIGRGTDISFVEVMNNVDDGIEIWGGTFNLKNFIITNIGDDGLDIDQGFRGKIQFGLITQGYSLDAPQGLWRRRQLPRDRWRGGLRLAAHDAHRGLQPDRHRPAGRRRRRNRVARQLQRAVPQQHLHGLRREGRALRRPRR
jgi:hypothetical protein